MKKIVALIIIISFSSCFAQKELWTVDSGDVNQYIGGIVKFDINGENPINMYEFSQPNGFYPRSKLLKASNGKLYGTANGGIIGPLGSPAYGGGWGVLYEYDLLLNKYKVVHFFNQNEGVITYYNRGIIEPIAGKIYGYTQNKIFIFDINTEILTFCTGDLGLYDIGANELMKASDGNLYGTTRDRNPCPSGSITGGYYYRGIYKVNLTTNNVQLKYEFKCDFLYGARPMGILVEGSPGKLYGIAESGGAIIPGVGISPHGTLFEYNFNTNVFNKKITFDGDNSGSGPQYLINDGNGRLLGVCKAGGTAVNVIGETRHNGTLFEYFPTKNVINVLQNYAGLTDFYKLVSPKSSLKTSNNTYIGNDGFYPFIYDAVLNTSMFTSALIQNIINTIATRPFTEICRKPSYQEFLPYTYTPEQGTNFTYNVQNTNATTYVWKKGTTLLPAQTTGILNLPSVTISDTGIYTCTMTNECGTTVTMPLNINVTNLATETIDNYAAFISLYPNPTKASISLKFPENRGLKALNYKVTNLLGQVVLENNIAKNNTANSITIDTAGFSNGIYQVTLATDKGNWKGKFVKE